MLVALTPNASTNTTHLLWAGRWLEVKESAEAWDFRNGTDAVQWLGWGLD